MKTSEGDRSAPCRRREYSSASRLRGRRLHNNKDNNGGTGSNDNKNGDDDDRHHSVLQVCQPMLGT